MTYLLISLCNLCVLCVSVVVVSRIPITTETQRTQRLHREEFNLGHYHVGTRASALSSVEEPTKLFGERLTAEALRRGARGLGHARAQLLVADKGRGVLLQLGERVP